MDKIGKYEILEKIGTGGFGVVFKGRDPFIKRYVAIKTCSSEDEEMRKRFFREAEIAGNLQHKNVTTVYDFGFEGEVPYLVQEYLPGEDLDQVIARRTLSDAKKLDYLVQIATGLAYAHEQGVIHRDIKPSNVRVVEGGRVKIMDFGIAKLANLESQLTKTGMTLGTASYLAPEQIKGDDLTRAVDIFSFGVLAYELFANRRPFEAQSLSNLFYQVLSVDPPPLRSLAPECPPELTAIIERCLAKEPADRWPTVFDLLAALEPLIGTVSDAGPDDTAGHTQRLPVDPSGDASETVKMTASAARDELVRVEARVGELLDAGNATAAEIEVTLARKRFAKTPGAGSKLRPLEARISEERQRNEAVRRRNDKVEALLTRGRQLEQTGNHDEAVLVLHTVLELAPQHEEAQRLLREAEARAAAERRRRALAEAAAGVAARLQRGELTVAAEELGRLAQQYGEAPELMALRGQLEQRRREARAAGLRQQAEGKVAAGELEVALALLREARDLAPEELESGQRIAALERFAAERRAAVEEAERRARREAEAAAKRAQREAEESERQARRQAAEAERRAQQERAAAEKRAREEERQAREAEKRAREAARREEEARAAAMRSEEEQRVAAAQHEEALRAEAARREQEAKAAAERRERELRAEAERRAQEEQRQRRQAELAAEAEAHRRAGDVGGAVARLEEALALGADAALAAQLASDQAEARRRREQAERQERVAAAVTEIEGLLATGKVKAAGKVLRRAAAADGPSPAFDALAARIATALQPVAAFPGAAAAPEPAAAAGETPLSRRGRLPWVAMAVGLGAVAVLALVLLWPGGKTPAPTGPAAAPAAAPGAASARGPANEPGPTAGVAPTGATGPAGGSRQEAPAIAQPPAVDIAPPPVLSATQPPAAAPADTAGAAQAAALVIRGERALAGGDFEGALRAAAAAQRAAPQDAGLARLVAQLMAQARGNAADAAARAAAAGAADLAGPQVAAARKRRAAGEAMAGSRPLAAARALRQSATLFDAAAADAGTEGRRREAALAEQRRQAAEQAARAQQSKPAPQATLAVPPSPPAEAARSPEPRASERPAPAEDEGAGVRDAIARYQRASESLDAAAVQAVWPSVDVAALRRGFAGAESLRMSVGGCEVKVQGAAATAACQRQQRVQPKAGKALSSSQKVRFRLHRSGGGWLIDGIDVL